MRKTIKKASPSRENNGRTLGAQLYDLRIDAGLSQREVAYKIGISDAALSKYERDEISPKPPILKCLFDYYGAPMPENFDQDTATYNEDLKVFERYGLSESFLKTLLFDKYFMGYNIAKNINLILKDTLDSNSLFKNLSLFFDYKLHERISNCIKEELPTALAKENCGRIFLHAITESLVSIFNFTYPDEQAASLKHSIEKQLSKVQLAKQEQLLEMVLAKELNKQPTDTP